MFSLRYFVWLSLVFPLTAPAANPLGFAETFALAADRGAVLKELIPGTPDAYYYGALHAQNSGNAGEALRLLEEWSTRFPDAEERRDLLLTRQKLLDFSKSPEATLEWLKEETDTAFDHVRVTAGVPPEVPSQLDPAAVAWEDFLRKAQTEDPQLGTLAESGLHQLFQKKLAGGLPQKARRAVLGRLGRPDLPGLVEILAEDLGSPESKGFGEFPIHGMLLSEQLEQLAKGRPALLSNRKFVETWLLRLGPATGLDPDRDPAVRLAWLERLQTFVETLPPTFNSIRAHVLYHRLEFDWKRGVCDRELFLAYLAIPRAVPYLRQEFRERSDLFRHPADLNLDLSSFTGLGPVGPEDESLVRRCLLLLLAQSPDPAPFRPYIDDSLLNALLAEAQLTANPGNAAQYTALLPAPVYQELRTRTDLEFDSASRQEWLPREEVHIDLWIKNVPRLLVRVYEIHTANVHRQLGRQINTDLDLDGLVANEELAFDYDSPPLQRVRRSFKFPKLHGRRGVWMVEFIGGGKSSRALIRKGHLKALALPTGAGTRLTVLDETAAPVASAEAFLGSQRFAANQDGQILLPFSTTPGDQPVLIGDGTGFTTLETLPLAGESYALTTSMHVPRESLVPGHQATLILRPTLLCNGRPTNPGALQNLQVTLTGTTLEGVSSTLMVPLKMPAGNLEWTVQFPVPQRLGKLTCQIFGEVTSLVTGEPVAVMARQEVAVHGITLSGHISDLHLSPAKDQWQISELGRTGEPLTDRQLVVHVTHQDFTAPLEFILKTGPAGFAGLGKLPGIASLSVRNAVGLERNFLMAPAQATHPETVSIVEGEPVKITWPASLYAPQDPDAPPFHLSILEVRQGQYFRAVTDGITLREGVVTIEGLKAGSYSIFCPAGSSRPALLQSLLVSAGKVEKGFVVTPAHHIELSPQAPVAIAGMFPEAGSPGSAPGDAEKEGIRFRILHADSTTRVHILSSRFLPAAPAFADLSEDHLPPLLQSEIPWRPSLYQSSRRIGEEYRYVLERQSRTPFAGNFLPRPGLLLNPWAIAQTTTGKQEAAAGEAVEAMQVERRKKASPLLDAAKPANVALGAALEEKESMGRNVAGYSDGIVPAPMEPDYQFLGEPGLVVTNLIPDPEGYVRISRKNLGHSRLLRVLALSSGSAGSRDFILEDQPLKKQDLRLSRSLDPSQPAALRNEATILEKDVPAQLKNALDSRLQTYAHLPEVWDLFTNMSSNSTLAEFSFLRRWPALDPEAKATLYSKYACHELHFFLSRKDPEFFRTVILPSLAHKRAKIFLDHYLLESDLTPWLSPSRYSRLNVVEKILLAKRLAPEVSATVVRDLSDQLALNPVSPTQEEFWFETALAGKKLDGAAVRGVTTAGLTGDFDSGVAPAPAPSSAASPLAPDAAPGTSRMSYAIGTSDGPNQRFRGLGDQELALRQLVANRPLYRQTVLTREWAENQYYHQPVEAMNAGLIPLNRFWLDYANWDGKAPFVSTHFPEAAGDFPSMMLALAVLDLPLAAEAPPVRRELQEGTLTLTSPTRTILFHQEIRSASAEAEPGNVPLLLSQNFYREGDRFSEENGKKSDKFVTGEFLTGTVYGCQIVVTNPTSSERKLQILFQIPAGSLPVLRTRPTQSVPLQLEPFRTATLDFHFYFPEAGEFAHFPTHASSEGQTAGAAAPVRLKVVSQLTTIDRTSWAWLSQEGQPAEVLEYLKKANLYQTDLGQIAWRLRDRPFYDQVVSLLRNRRFQDEAVFSYGLYHGDVPAIRDWLALREPLVREPLDSPLLTVDPVEAGSFQWLEYSPLINARAHQLGQDRIILNDRFQAQYDSWIRLLSFHPALTDEDCLGIATTLLLQDRIDEAGSWLKRVNPEAIAERIQYDYMRGWLAMSTGDTELSSQVTTARAGSPMPAHWQSKFQEMKAQLDEIAGAAPAAPQPRDRDSAQDRLARAEPQYSLRLEKDSVLLEYRNLKEVTVQYYPMDLEFLFSANPFSAQDSSRFRMIRPAQSERLVLDSNQNSHRIPLPQEWQKSNVLIEVTAGGLTQSVASYANQLEVQISENFGQLQVLNRADQRPMPRTYVKVFAEIEGKPVFYKDGYTDLRGKFDYTSLSTNDLDQTTRFSILVLSSGHGAAVREVKPPAR